MEDPELGDLVARLSVLGDAFDVALAAEVAGLEPEELLRSLAPAVREGLVEVEPDLVRFAPGCRDPAYARLAPQVRARTHARAAEVLQRTRPGDLTGIAEQRTGALALLGLEPVLEALEAAAAGAERAVDWPHAASLLERAVSITSARHDPRAGRLALRRARCLYRTGLFADAMAVVRDVARSARRAGDPRLLADAALVVRGIADRDTSAELLDLCRDALRDGSQDGAQRARLLAQVVLLTSNLRVRRPDRGLADESVRLAEASGEAQAVVESLHALHEVLTGPAHVDERLRIAGRAETLARAAGLDDLLAWPLRWRVDALFQKGRRPAIDDALTELESFGRARNDGLVLWKARMAWAVLAELEGRFDDALRMGAEAQEMAARGGHQLADFVYRILLSECLRQTGRADMREALDLMPLGGDVFLTWPARLAACRGDAETAAALFDRALPAMHDIDGWDLQVQTHASLALVAWILDRPDAAAELSRALGPFADELAESTTGQAGAMGSVSRYLGQMAALLGDWERAEADFAWAVRRNLEVDGRPAVAETRVDWARALLRRGLVRDRERAADLLRTAARDAASMGMEPLRTEAEAALRRLEAGPAHPLTPRELEVALLVAEGLSNKEVATRLRLSVRTAENHLLNVMNKLGFENRAQVAAWVERTGSAR